MIGSMATNPTVTLGWSSVMDMHKSQEFILFDSNQSINRSGIETNINAHFRIYQPTTQPTSGLLYDYGSATGGTDAACMTVRRDMGVGNPGHDDEITIGFDTNGDLDTQAISDFCGTGTGYVSRWWDQSVNGNHAEQSTPSSQPQIYDGTAVITENGKPAVAGGHMDLSSGISQTTKNLGYFVVNKQNSGHFSWVLGTSFSNKHNLVLERFGKIQFRHPTDGLIDIAGTGTVTMGQQNLIYAMSNNTKLDARVNAVDVADSSPFNSVSSSIQELYNGRFGANTATTTKFQEIILYLSDESSSVSGIETDINNYFSIY